VSRRASGRGTTRVKKTAAGGRQRPKIPGAVLTANSSAAAPLGRGGGARQLKCYALLRHLTQEYSTYVKALVQRARRTQAADPYRRTYFPLFRIVNRANTKGREQKLAERSAIQILRSYVGREIFDNQY
jgi:hypothetical protein